MPNLLNYNINNRREKHLQEVCKISFMLITGSCLSRYHVCFTRENWTFWLGNGRQQRTWDSLIFVLLPRRGWTPIYKGQGCSSGNFKWTPERYQSVSGLSRILPLKGTNQKHRDKQLVAMNLIAIKIKIYIRRCLNEMPFNWPWHP